MSNDRNFTIKLLSKDKRLIQSIFRLKNRHKVFIYLTFSALVFLILNEVKPTTKVVIDKEYPGNEKLIKAMVVNMGCEVKFDFALVGKSSNAHNLAYRTFKEIIRTNKVIKLEEILKLISANKKDRVSRY